MTVAETESEATESVTHQIMPDDKCDQCGVDAFVKVITNTGPLLLCGHHYAQHESAISVAGYEVHDERHKLLLRDYRIDVWTQDVKRSGK